MPIHSKQCPKCLKPIEEDDSKPGVFLNPTRDKVAFPFLEHICDGGEAKNKGITKVRSDISVSSPSAASIPSFLFQKVNELKTLGLSVEVANQDAMVPFMAEDMARKDVKKGNANATAENMMSSARSQITDNKCTAFTTSNDLFIALKNGAPFDELHEFLHICSGEGGESPLNKEMGTKTNEGAINYFAELVALACGVPYVLRYQNETLIFKRLIALANKANKKSEALVRLYAMTFKGEIDPFFDLIAKIYKSNDHFANGKPKGDFEKKKEHVAVRDDFKRQVKNHSVKWVEDRTPAV